MPTVHRRLEAAANADNGDFMSSFTVRRGQLIGTTGLAAAFGQGTRERFDGRVVVDHDRGQRLP
jgi:hypothetical protein